MLMGAQAPLEPPLSWWLWRFVWRRSAIRQRANYFCRWNNIHCFKWFARWQQSSDSSTQEARSSLYWSIQIKLVAFDGRKSLTTIDLLTFILYKHSFIITTLMFTRLSRRTRSAPRTLPSPMSMTGKYSAPLLSATILNRMRAKPFCWS